MKLNGIGKECSTHTALLQISSAENRLKSLAIPLEAFKLLSYNFGANHTKKAGTMAFWDS